MHDVLIKVFMKPTTAAPNVIRFTNVSCKIFFPSSGFPNIEFGSTGICLKSHELTEEIEMIGMQLKTVGNITTFHKIRFRRIFEKDLKLI